MPAYKVTQEMLAVMVLMKEHHANNTQIANAIGVKHGCVWWYFNRSRKSDIPADNHSLIQVLRETADRMEVNEREVYESQQALKEAAAPIS